MRGTSITKKFARPNMRHMLAPSMAARTQGFKNTPFGRMTEVSERQVVATVDSMVSHLYKSLASTKGGDFESFSAVMENPWLPMDLKEARIILGEGANPNRPISKTNPPDEKTNAFLLEGGHFYTVRMIVPKDIKNKFVGKGKGDDAEGDYYIVIPPGPTENTYKVHIIEFKTGMGHFKMDETEEDQMLKEKEVIEHWYRTIGKTVKVYMYYCPFLAGNAEVYAQEHRSSSINYITLSGLSKILNVPESTMEHYAKVRSNYNKKFTQNAFRLKNMVVTRIRKGEEMSLDNMKKLSTINFGVNFGPNVKFEGNYQKRRARLVKLLTRRRLIKNAMKQSNSTKKLMDQLVNVTKQILIENKYANNKLTSNSLLDSNFSNKLENWLRQVKNAPRGKVAKETTFRLFLEERRKLLGAYRFPQLDTDDIVKPMGPSMRKFMNVRAMLAKKNLKYNDVTKISTAHKLINKSKLSLSNQIIYNEMDMRIRKLYKLIKPPPKTKGRTAAVPISTVSQMSNLEMALSPRPLRPSPKKPSPSPKKPSPSPKKPSPPRINNPLNFPSTYRTYSKIHGARGIRALNNALVKRIKNTGDEKYKSILRVKRAMNRGWNNLPSTKRPSPRQSPRLSALKRREGPTPSPLSAKRLRI